MNKEIKDLEDLVKINKVLNTLALEKRLTDLNYEESANKLFKPITDKQNEIISTIKENQLAITNTSNFDFSKVKPLTSTGSNNNSYFKEVSTSGSITNFGLKLINYNSETNLISSLNGQLQIPMTEGLGELLFVDKFNQDNITRDDINNYYSIYDKSGISPGNSERKKE
jgi:hypothetical protein